MFQINQLTNIHGFSKGLEVDDDRQVGSEKCHVINSHHPFPAPVLASSKRDHDHDHCDDGSDFNDLFQFDMGLIQPLTHQASLCDDDDQNPDDENPGVQRERPYSASLHILRSYKSRLRKLNVHKVQLPGGYPEKEDFTGFTICNNDNGSQKLSTNCILRLAAENFIECSTKGDTESSAINHPYASAFAGLCQEDAKAVQLVQFLLASAEKVGRKQFGRASKLLIECDKGSSDQGSTIERLVYYYSGALQERIDRETGTFSPRGLGNKQCKDMLETMGGPSPDIMAMQNNVPFGQIFQFAGIQAVLDHVGDATKIHVVDLEIRTGMHWTILMQALATKVTNPVEYVKITAVGTKSRANLEATRDRLASFARSLNLKFYFNIVMVDQIMDLNESLFEVKPDEAVAVWADFFLMFMIGRQDVLESLMNVVRALKPKIMVVTEVEGNNNSPVFVTRFIESLFHYGGFFDCLEDCLKHDPTNRYYVEYVYFSQAIRSIVATEGAERTIRHVAVHVWRSFFARFGFVQAELSSSSMYQANLVLENFACGKSCTLDMDGKCLIVGWKGTPIYSLSAWRIR
ncbi:OLC1v1020624C1 [Oldenlandia corymbosa var. corymbosa]|uniref:OLC1v1020624C1 n=1 Tax=Oldenlandia corymbosa var. corymbosa TaxID=529605 RepID=A0AAV1EGX9_OLDCO|nr:OLC1v1020624C1 [Oldenlandia corymbosa var. corymbosa]